MFQASGKPGSINGGACRRRQGEGFTLTEIMVVIIIMTLMTLMLFSVSARVRNASRVTATKSLMSTLETIADEYQTTRPTSARQPMSRVVNHLELFGETGLVTNVDRVWDWTNAVLVNAPAAVTQNKNATVLLDGHTQSLFEDRSIERFVALTYQNSQIRQMYQSIDNQYLIDLDENDMLELCDPWGHKLIYAAYVVQGNEISGDNTTDHTEDDFLPEHGTRDEPKPFFVSAGPDGKWGDLSSSSDPQVTGLTETEYQRRLMVRRQAKDNIYSFNP